MPNGVYYPKYDMLTAYGCYTNDTNKAKKKAATMKMTEKMV
jgi:hypothetical protein